MVHDVPYNGFELRVAVEGSKVRSAGNPLHCVTKFDGSLQEINRLIAVAQKGTVASLVVGKYRVVFSTNLLLDHCGSLEQRLGLGEIPLDNMEAG